VRVAAVASLAMLVIAAPIAAARPPERAQVPSAGTTLVVVGQDPQSERDYVTETGGRVPAGFMHYVFLEQDPAAFSAHLREIDGVANAYPGTAIQIGLTMGYSTFWSATNGNPQPPGALQVARGTYDRQLDLLAAWLKSLSVPVYLRVGYEFDLLGGQWGPPQLYKRGYRYIVRHLRSAGVRNALYVWHSSGAYFKTLDYSGAVGLLGTLDRTGGALDPLLEALAAPRGDLQPISEYYPGRRYVDMFAVSYWDDCYGFGRSSERARAIYRERTREILDQARALGLPLAIGESTPAYIGFDSHAESITWLRRYFELIADYDIRMLSLIVPDWPAIDGGYWGQADWNGYWPDARVHHFRDVREYWLAKLDEPRYRELAG
jgi:hypothetical protein